MTIHPQARRWSIEAKFPGDPLFTIQVVEADDAAPWTDGVLYLWDRGSRKGQRRTVLALAPGEWRSCESLK